MSKSSFDLNYIKASSQLAENIPTSYSESLAKDRIQQSQVGVSVPTDSPMDNPIENQEEIIAHGKLNDGRTWVDEMKSIAIGNLWSTAVMQIAATGMAIADPVDAIADPFSLSLNGLRKLLWNLSPNNPIGLMPSLFDKNVADVNATMLNAMNTDEVGKAITWTASDDDVIPGLGIKVKDARAWWDSKRDGKPSNAVAQFFYDDYKLMEDRKAALGEYQGAGAYWVNNATNLVGSVGASVLTGYLTGGVFKGLGSLKSVPSIGTKAINLNKLNNLDRLGSYRKFSEGAVAFSQVGGESLMEGMQARESALDRAYREAGGAGYEQGLQKHLDKRFAEMKAMNPDVVPDGTTIQEGMRKFKDEYRNIWNQEHPELGNKITEMGDLAFETTVNFNSLNFLLNLSIAGKYLKPSRNKILTNPKLLLDKSTLSEMAQEYGEESVNAISQIMADSKVFEGHANTTDFIRAYGQATVHEQGAWGALGGGGQVMITNAINLRDNSSQGVKARYKAQQEIIKRFHEVENMADPNLIDKHVFLSNNLAQVATELEKIDALHNQNRTTEAKAATSRLFQTQALNAFETGTTKALTHMYQKLSENTALTEEQRTGASQALGHIQALEKIYNNVQKYTNADEVYANEANAYLIKKSIDERIPIVEDKFDAAKASLKGILSEGKAKNFISEQAISLIEQYNPKDTVEDLFTPFENETEEQKKIRWEANDFISSIAPISDYRGYSKEVRQAQYDLDDLKYQHHELISNGVQEENRIKNDFYKTMAQIELIGRKELQKKGKEFSPYTSKAYEAFYMRRLKQLGDKGHITNATYNELKKDFVQSKMEYELREQLNKIQEAAIPTRKSNADTTPAVTNVSNPDVVPEVDAAHIANTVNTINIFEQVASKPTIDPNATAEEINLFDVDEFGTPTGASFAPRRATDKTSETEWKYLEENMLAYFEGLKTKLGINPTFKDVVNDVLENSDRDRTEGIYDFLAEAWRRNSVKDPAKFQAMDSEKIHSEIFNPLSTLRNNFFQAENFGEVEDIEAVSETNEVPVTEDEKKYALGERVLNTPASTAAYSSHNYKQVLTPVYKEENGEKKIDYIQVTWVYEKTEMEEFMDEITPFSSKFINARPIVHPDHFIEGDRLTAKVHPDFKSISYFSHWKTTEWYDGLPMELAEGERFITYQDALNGVTAKFKVPVDIQQDAAVQETIDIAIKIEEGSEEYWNTVPMVFTKEGSELSEGSAFIHTPDWYHNSRFVEEDKKATAIAETKAIRKAVKDNGSVSLTITSKTIGTADKCKVYNYHDESGIFSKVTLKESNPQSFIVVAAAESRGGFLVRNEVGELVSFDNDKRFIAGADNLREMMQRNKTTVFQVMRAGTVEDRESYVGFPLYENDIQKIPNSQEYYTKIAQNIKWAIDAYMSQSDPSSIEAHQTAEEFYRTTGYSIVDIAGLNRYISSMIQPMGKNVNANDNIEEALTKVVEEAEKIPQELMPNGTPYIAFVKGQIQIGIKGKSFSDNKGGTFKLQIINRASKANARVFHNLQGTVLNDQVFEQLAKGKKNINLEGFKGDEQFVTFKEDGTIDQAQTTTYTDFLMNTLYSDFKAVNIGTEANPFYTVFVQPTIAFARTEAIGVTVEEKKEFNDTGVIPEIVKQKIEEKQKEGLPLTAAEEEIVTKEPVVVPETIIAENELSEEDLAFILAMSESTNNLLSPEEREIIKSLEDLKKKKDEMSSAAIPLADESVQRIREASERIPGLLPHEQDELVNVLSQYIFEKLGQTEDAKLSDVQITELCYRYMFNHITPLIQNKVKEIARAKAIASLHPELTNLATAIIQSQKLIDKCNLILENRDLIVNEVYQSIANENAVVERDVDGEKLEREEEDLDIESSYSKSELEENIREQASSQIRRFLRGIPQRNTDGSVKLGFLGFPSPVDIDTLFNTLTGLLADRPANLEGMLKVLREHGVAHPEIFVKPKEGATQEELARIAQINKNTLVGRLQEADKQVQGQFVSLMTKHAVKMKFAMYSYNRRTKKFSLRVWDTNSSSVVRKIQSDWNSNIMEKMTEVNKETGEYVMNPVIAEYLLEKFDSWKGVNYDLIDLAEVGAPNVAIGLRELPAITQSKVSKGEAVEVDLRNNRANAPLTLMMNKRREATPDHVGVKAVMGKEIVHITPTAIDGIYTISKPKKSAYTHQDLINWLSNVGITISPEVMTELSQEGIIAGEKNNKRIKLSQMFQESAKSDGIFGLVAHKLREVVNANKRTDEEGNPAPKHVTFGYDADINFNDEVIAKLARIEAKYTSHAVSTSWRDNGKTIYGFSPTKFVTDRVNALKNFEKIGDKMVSKIIEDLKKVGFSKEALLIQLLENSPDFLSKFQVSHIGLTAIKEAGKAVYKDNGITKLSDADHELAKRTGFEDMKQGSLSEYFITVDGRKYQIPMRMATMFGLTMSDKDAMFEFQTGVFSFNKRQNFELDVATQEVKGINSVVKELLYQQTVLPELRRAVEFAKNGTTIHGHEGRMMFFFPALNNVTITEDGVEKALVNVLMKGDRTLEQIEAAFKPAILDKLSDSVNTLVENKIKTWKEEGFIVEVPAVYKETPTGEFTETDQESNIPIMEKKLVSEARTELKFFDEGYLHSMGEKKIELQIQLAAYDYTLNYLIHNANMFMVFAGDPAQYYKKDKSTSALDYVGIVRDTFINVGKRMALLNAPGNKIMDSDTNKYIELILEDSENKANNYGYIEKILGKDAAEAYLETKGTDGQEYTTWQEHLYILEKMGRTPESIMNITPAEIQEARRLFSSGKSLSNFTERDKLIMKKALQPMKPVYTGSEFDDANGIMRTLYIKTSSFPLIPQLTEGLEIDKLRKMMEKIQDTHGKTVRATYHSGAKTGSYKKAMKVIDGETMEFIHTTEDNRRVSLEDVDVNEIVSKYGVILSRSNFRIQQDVPFKTAKREEDIVSMGTQMVKLMFGSGAMDINNFAYFGGFNDKGEFITNLNTKNGKEALEIYQTLFNKLIVYKKQQLYKQLGLNLMGQIKEGKTAEERAKNTATVAKRIQRILKEEAIGRGYPKQDIDSLEIDGAGNFIIPIWLLSNGEKLESLLNAIVEKRIAKIKLPGNAYVVGSEFGFKLKVRKENEISDEVKSGIIWINEEAQNGLSHNQVLVASKFRNKEGKIIDLISEGYAIQKTENGRTFWVLNKEKFDPEVLSMLNFRTPTSAHNSMSVDEIAGFLPYESADLMIVSRNKTIQKGIDFDIDKESAYQLWHTIDESGKIVGLDKVYSLSDIDVLIDNKLKTIKSLKKAGLQDAEAQALEEWSYDNEILEDLTEEEEAKLQEEFVAGRIKEITSQRLQDLLVQVSELKKIKEKLYHNEIIKLQTVVLSHKEMQKNMIKVLSMDKAEETASEISRLKEGNDTEEFSPLSDEYQKSKVFLGASGKIAVGAYSLDVVGHSLFQQAAAVGKQLQLNQKFTDEEGKEFFVPYHIRFGEGNTYVSDGYIGNNKTLGTDVNRRLISDVLSERQNIATDNEKVQIMGRAHLNDITIDADKVLTMLGFDSGEDGHNISMLFLSQPIIVDYVNELRKISSNIAGFTKNKKEVVTQILVEKYGGQGIYDHSSLNDIEKASDQMTNEEFKKQISNNGSNHVLQQAVLFRFLDLAQLGLDLRKVQTTINIDSKGLGISLFESLEKIQKVEDLIDIKAITNADALVGDYMTMSDTELTRIEMIELGYIPLRKYYVKPATVAGSFTVHSLSATYNLWSKYFPYDSETVNQIFTEIEEIIGATNEANESESNRLRFEDKQDILREIKKYLFSSHQLGLFREDAQAERNRLFMDEFQMSADKKTIFHTQTSLAYYLKTVLASENTPDIIKKNLFLRTLTFDIQKNGAPSLIKFNNTSDEGFNPDAVYRSVADLFTATVNGKPVELIKLNHKTYTSIDLAQDLMAYAYLEGGIQEVIQFVKFVPVSYLKEMPFSRELRRIHNLFTAVNPVSGAREEILTSTTTLLFGINPRKMNKEKGSEHKYSRATVQYIQHHPESITKVSEEDIKDGSITLLGHHRVKIGADSIKGLGTLQEFATKGPNPPAFLSIYDNEIPKGQKKFQLFRYDTDSKTYKKIPVYGVFGMSEYNLNSKTNYYKSLVNKTQVIQSDISEEANPVQKPKEVPTGENAFKASLKNTTMLTDSHIQELISIFEADETINPLFTNLLKEFREAISRENIQLEVVNSIINPDDNKSLSSYGAYHQGKIFMLKSFVEGGTNDEVARVYLHEIVHGLVNSVVDRYFFEAGSNSEAITGAPQYMVRLGNLYKQARKEMGDDAFFQKFDMVKGLTQEQFDAYGGLMLKEFITEVMTNPTFQKRMASIKYAGTNKTLYQKFLEFVKHALSALGINIPQDSITYQGMISVMELVQDKMGGILYNTRLEHAEGFKKAVLGLEVGDVITMEYFSGTSSERDFKVRTVKIEEIYSDRMRGLDNMTGEVRTFLFNSINAVMRVEKAPSTDIDIWYGKDQNPLSNLAERKFTFGGRDYISVEQAYQSLKSGDFDQETYNEYIAKGAGSKIRSRKTALTTDDYNLILMKDLIYASVKQNPKIADLLTATGSANITHKMASGIWKTEFPKILMQLRYDIKNTNLMEVIDNSLPDVGYTVKIDQYSFTIKGNKVYYANGNEVTDKTILSKVHLETQADMNRVVEYNGYYFYVMPDGTIVSYTDLQGQPVQHYGKEAYVNSKSDRDNILRKYNEVLENQSDEDEVRLAELRKLEEEMKKKDQGTQSLSPAPNTDLFSMENIEAQISDTFVDESGQKIC